MCLREMFGLEGLDVSEDEIVALIREANLHGKDELVFYSQGKKVIISLK